MSDHENVPHNSGRPRARYGAYLLRFWAESRGKPGLPPIWRFGLEDAHSGRRWAFAGMDQLVVFLRREIESGPVEEGRGSRFVKEG